MPPFNETKTGQKEEAKSYISFGDILEEDMYNKSDTGLDVYVSENCSYISNGSVDSDEEFESETVQKASTAVFEESLKDKDVESELNACLLNTDGKDEHDDIEDLSESEPLQRQLVSIYMIPLKDEDDSDESCGAFSGRTSPWPVEDDPDTSHLNNDAFDEKNERHIVLFGPDEQDSSEEKISEEKDNAKSESKRMPNEKDAQMLIESQYGNKSVVSEEREKAQRKIKDDQSEMEKHCASVHNGGFDNEGSQIELLKLSLEQSVRLTNGKSKIVNTVHDIVSWSDTASENGQVQWSKSCSRSTSRSSVKGSNLVSRRGSNASGSSQKRPSKYFENKGTKDVRFECDLTNSPKSSRQPSPTWFKTVKPNQHV